MLENQLGIDLSLLVIGLMILVLILMVAVIALLVKTTKLQKKYDAFLTGRSGKSLEQIMVKMVQDMDGVNRSNAMTEKKMDAVLKMHRDSYEKISIVRYDAFRGMTGKLSFVLGLLDGRNSGFLLNCMHNNDGCYVYLREVLNGEAIGSLSSEERKALDEVLRCEKND